MIVSLDTPINLNPETKEEEVVQNVRMIISTAKSEVPIETNIGCAHEYIDQPINVAATLAMAEIADAVEEYESRASIKSVQLEADHETGKLTPRVEVEINE